MASNTFSTLHSKYLFWTKQINLAFLIKQTRLWGSLEQGYKMTFLTVALYFQERENGNVPIQGEAALHEGASCESQATRLTLTSLNLSASNKPTVLEGWTSNRISELVWTSFNGVLFTVHICYFYITRIGSDAYWIDWWLMIDYDEWDILCS